VIIEIFGGWMMEKQTIRICGRDFPVIGYTPEDGIPIVDLPMISDEEWQRRATASREKFFNRKEDTK